MDLEMSVMTHSPFCVCFWNVNTYTKVPAVLHSTPATSSLQSFTWRKGPAQHFLLGREFQFHFTNYPQVTGNSSLKVFIIFQFSCLPTVDNLHLHLHATPVDNLDATVVYVTHSVVHSHTSCMALRDQIQHYPVDASVTNMVLARSQIIWSGLKPCL